MAEFRARTQIVDPQADVQARMGVFSNFQQQLAEALVEFDLLSQTADANDPRMRQLNRRIEAIRHRIRDERLNFTKHDVTIDDTEDDTDYLRLIAQFERLQVDQVFAEATYQAALTAMDAGRSNASRQNLYLANFIQPTRAQRAQYPQTTLLNMVSGTMRPDTNEIISDGSISFTVAYSGNFHKDMAGAQNTRFLARVYGVDTDELCDFVEDFAEIGSHFHMPVRTYSSGMKARLAFGVSMGIKIDTYLIDEATATGDARFKCKSKDVFRARTAEASAVMVSHSMSDIRAFCDAGLVLNDGQIEAFDDIEEAIARHQGFLA
ncbi:hypothetical protein [Roseinatronobacter bogoriensis]|uniref:hypothetical protein n=1 Tax=Roseinatronobacter bogoriensis TaxID=119542 RepID=UPI0010625E36|nr:hypothetical protein [Rhodobaca]MBB4207098.1 ABC-type Na+ transport system ATPase subunit NatA [Rhodobaca bogoriensis DSM 18756]